MCAGSDFYLHCALMIREREPPLLPLAGGYGKLLSAAEDAVPSGLTAERTAAVSWGLTLGSMTWPHGGPLLQHMVEISWKNAGLSVLQAA